MTEEINGCIEKYFSDEKLDAYIYFPNSPVNKKAWIAFGAFQQEEMFGLVYFTKRQIASVIIKPHINDWYQNESLPHALLAGVEKLIYSGFSIDCGYGSSMGGFAAIAFSQIYKPRLIIAIAPQVSIFQEVVGCKDRRWADLAVNITPFLSDCRCGFYKYSKLIVCYDPLHSEDSHNVKLIQQKITSLITIKFPMAGHGLLSSLKSLNILSSFIDTLSTMELKLTDNDRISEIQYSFKIRKRESHDYWFNLAQKMYEKGKLDNSLTFCYISIKKSDTHFSRKLLSEIWEKKNYLQMSLANLERAIELAPFIGGYAIAYGILLVKNGSIDRALLVFNRTIKIFPLLSGAYACLADIYARKDNYKESLACIEYALKLGGMNEAWNNHRAYLIEHLNNSINNRALIDGKNNFIEIQDNEFSNCEMYQDYFDGIWVIGVKSDVTSGIIPFSYLEIISLDNMKGVWQYEKNNDFLSSAKIEIDFAGKSPNEFIFITPPTQGFIAFEFIAPESDTYKFRFLVTDGQALLICDDENQSSWLCDNGLSSDFCLYKDKEKITSFCLLVLTKTVTLHIHTTKGNFDTIEVKSPGSNLGLFKNNASIHSADIFQINPFSNKYPRIECLSRMDETIKNFLKFNIPDIEKRLEKTTYSKPHKKYLIFFVPRSGSTLLSELISKSDVAGFPFEYFIPTIYYTLKSIVHGGGGNYINFIEKSFQSKNGVFGAEIEYDRYTNFWHWYIKPNLDTYRIILVDRKDFVGQIVSQYYANETGIFFDYEDKVIISNRLSLDINKLKQVFYFLVRHKLGIRKINQNYSNIVYFEDIISGNYAEKISDELELNELEFKRLKYFEISNCDTFFKAADSQGKTLLAKELFDYIELLRDDYIIYKHNGFVVRSAFLVDDLLDDLILIDQREPGLFYPFISIEYSVTLFDVN